jgi:hypothetical protein
MPLAQACPLPASTPATTPPATAHLHRLGDIVGKGDGDAREARVAAVGALAQRHRGGFWRPRLPAGRAAAGGGPPGARCAAPRCGGCPRPLPAAARPRRRGVVSKARPVPSRVAASARCQRAGATGRWGVRGPIRPAAIWSRGLYPYGVARMKGAGMPNAPGGRRRRPKPRRRGGTRCARRPPAARQTVLLRPHQTPAPPSPAGRPAPVQRSCSSHGRRAARDHSKLARGAGATVPLLVKARRPPGLTRAARPAP